MAGCSISRSLPMDDTGSRATSTPSARTFIAATIEHEDRHFFRHAGVNPLSLARAAWGAATGQRLGGGSTLTMQYARLRFGLETRSWPGKFAQIVRAVQLERHHSKREILAAYFTLAPYGGNVEGVSAASLRWCGKSPQELTRREAVALSVIPQSPAARCPRASDNPALMAAQARLLAKLSMSAESHGPGRQAPPRTSADTLDAQFCLHPHPVPRGAPHFSRRLLAAATDRVVHSTLDPRAQHVLEETTGDFLRVHAGRGLDNGAAILVHSPTREVRAWLGSAGFFNDAIRGQIDGVTARRSPGSALKPFVYALALDHGLIHPRTLVDDAPRRFAGYQPENSDRGFLGPVSATEALWRSRNVPAIDLEARLPRGGLHPFLVNAGVRLDPNPGRYGLTLPLGGAEVTLEELARLYAMLADDGIPRSLRMTGSPVTQLVNPSPPLLTPASCFLVRQMLEADPAARAGLAVKTGTSHGFRDAWAVGVRGEWVLAVWLGHFDGRPMPNLFARETAAPLLGQMVERLDLPAAANPAPPSVARVDVCAVSGELPGSHCVHLARSWFIPGVLTHRHVRRASRGVDRPGERAGGRARRRHAAARSARLRILVTRAARAFPPGRCAAQRTAGARDAPGLSATRGAASAHSLAARAADLYDEGERPRAQSRAADCGRGSRRAPDHLVRRPTAARDQRARQTIPLGRTRRPLGPPRVRRSRPLGHGRNRGGDGAVRRLAWAKVLEEPNIRLVRD